MSPPLISKAAARYTGAGGKEHCSLCRHFSPRRGGRCARVLGDISPRGWCRLFSREMRGLVADASSFNSGGGPALGLDFMVPGVLDPRITFTRASTGTYFDSAGVLRSAAVNAPRWDYDPATLALRGLLIEEARTNLWLQSADASNPAWVPGGGVVAPPVVTANQTIAPDGTLTAARVAYPAVSGANAYSELYQGITTTAGATYTHSMWLKGAVGGEQVYIAVLSGTTGRVLCTLTTQWQRFSYTSAVAIAGTGYFIVGVDLRDSQTAKPAQTVFVWGGQVEAGAFATSYIPTTSATVARAGELATMPAAGWYIAGPGSLAADFMMPQSPNPTANARDACTLNDGGSTNRWVLRALTASVSTAMFFTASSGAAVSSTSLGVVSANAVSKIAVAIDGTTPRGVLNAGSPVSTSAIFPLNLSLLAIGSQGSGTPALNGWIRRIRYWPSALSNADLQSVTT
jgi:hypothetical protein